MKRQEYLDLKKRYQKEFEDFPIAYAFNDKQLQEALEKLGATKEEVVGIKTESVLPRYIQYFRKNREDE